MEGEAFKEFLRGLIGLKTETRIPKIREVWQHLTKDQQHVLEEFLERLRETQEEEPEVRRGEVTTEAAPRRREEAQSSDEEAPEPRPEEAIYTREETTSTEDVPEEEERRPYRTETEEVLTFGREEEKPSELEEGEYVRETRERREENAIPGELGPVNEMETDLSRKAKRKYVEE